LRAASSALVAALAVESLRAAALAIGDFNTCRAVVDEPGARKTVDQALSSQNVSNRTTS
jgi:hypothetical protein